MNIEIGKFYRLKVNRQYRVKVESISGRKVVYSRPGSIISKGTSIADFRIKFEKCP